MGGKESKTREVVKKEEKEGEGKMLMLASTLVVVLGWMILVEMQVLENDGTYREPESLKPEKLQGMFEDRRVKRILVFPAYDNGRPTPELRRAWRRYDRTRRRK